MPGDIGGARRDDSGDVAAPERGVKRLNQFNIGVAHGVLLGRQFIQQPQLRPELCGFSQVAARA
jgi:hypothetical protein